MNRILAATIALAGCAVDPAQPLDVHVESDPGVGPIAFSSQGSYALWTSNSATMDLGPTAGRTCFLSGVAGTIESLGVGQELKIETQGADYQLTIFTEFPVKVWARCVPAPGTADVEFHAGQVVIAPMQAGRRCFLTAVDVMSEIPKHHAGFDSFDAWVAITHDDTNWLLGASDEMAGNMFAHARCVDGTETEGTWFAQAPDPGTATEDLPDVTGETCGLTELRGAFDSTDFTDGTYVTRDDASGLLQLTATNGKRGEVGCVK